jgi:hypothetical protein
MINAKGFEFNNHTSEEFGLIICNFDSGDSEGSAGSHMSFTLSSSPILNRWYKFGNAVYDEQLSFSFQVAKINFESFDSYELASIQRWLIRKDDYKDFQFIKGDYDDVHFNAQINISEYQYIGGEIYGFTIEVTCDSPFGYAHEITKKVDTSVSDTIEFYDISDEIGYIYPDIEIETPTGGDITIINSFDNRKFYINNCENNEIITIDGKILQFTTTVVNHDIYSNTNYTFPRISNDDNNRKNVFTITGNAIVTMKYRPVRKVGV